jgi:predicted DNA-binding transcriptional regulator AlpA
MDTTHYLNAEQVAHKLGIGKETLYKRIRAGRFPQAAHRLTRIAVFLTCRIRIRTSFRLTSLTRIA